MTEKGKNTPTVRFKGFTDDWEQRKLGEIVTEVNRTDEKSVAPVMMITAENGFIRQSERYAYNNSGKSLKKYIILKYGELAYNHGASKLRPYGSCFALTTEKEARIPFVYHCFAANHDNARYLSLVLNGEAVAKQLKRIVSSGARMDGLLNISFEDYETIPIMLPSKEEQDTIVDYFIYFDHLIALHQRQLDEQKALKKYFLQNMFPAKGEKVPRIRFQGFTDDWEERKLGELVIIERGGSPRPIDAYITDAQDGLNWVKIGDAPEQGRYITHTEEKIKPSGLSKTRQVFQGDLILSNSMSFGKPYIMGIQGCIHDGWLLIRNNQNVFDLKFLCQMLGTEQMLAQYRQLAAGSTVNNLNKELVSNAIVKVPRKAEQEKIGTFLESIDNVITLHQRQLTQLQAVKKFMLQNLFV